MQIIVGKTAGFCFGVSNAVTKTEEKINEKDSVYCLGELVHNNQVTEELKQKGVKFVDDIQQASDSIIIRSHGVEKSIYDKAKELGLSVIDLTCPKVLHIHKVAEEYAKKEYFIFIIGKAKHPEMIGTVSFCGKYYDIIEDETDVLNAVEKYKKSNKKNVVIISQTTFSLEKFHKIVELIKSNISIENLEIKNTICNATKERQEETIKIAKQVDTMVIIGGKHSSNSNKLYELSKKYCENVFFVETEDEIEEENFRNSIAVGIMAGASTPQKSIHNIVEKLREMC